MPRGQLILKKPVVLDPKYKNPVVGKFITRMMDDGKKSKALTALYGAFR
jgi:ribosomal protein S7